MPLPSAGSDLEWTFRTALERAHHLLSPDELEVVQTVLALSDELRSHFARLVRRTHATQRRTDVEPHATHFEALGLIVPQSDPAIQAHRATVAELKEGAKRLGLSTRGKRQALVERLAEQPAWSNAAWVNVQHRVLVQRMDRLAFLQRHPDPNRAVVERLGHVVWPTYAVGECPPLFESRDALLAWEALSDQVDLAADGDVSPIPLLTALQDATCVAPGRLDLTRPIVRVVTAFARELERQNDPGQARTLYRAVMPHHRRPAELAIRIARTYEATQQPNRAWDVLHAEREVVGPTRLAVHRAGRRLAKITRRGWAPSRPAKPLVERTVPLEASGLQNKRPTFRDGAFVEEAIIDLLATEGRAAIHGEGALWRHLYGLCLAPHTYFLPVGMLPVRFLSGPLDVGQPAFAARREEAVAKVLGVIRAGGAESLVEESYANWEGEQLAGVRWRTPEEDRALVLAIGPTLLSRVLEVLVMRGWRASRGLPDLVVLPGEQIRLPGAMPSRLAPSVVLAELKTPSDSLSDGQRWWLDYLEPVAQVEVWRIRPVAGPVCTA